MERRERREEGREESRGERKEKGDRRVERRGERRERREEKAQRGREGKRERRGKKEEKGEGRGERGEEDLPLNNYCSRFYKCQMEVSRKKLHYVTDFREIFQQSSVAVLRVFQGNLCVVLRVLCMNE